MAHSPPNLVLDGGMSSKSDAEYARASLVPTKDVEEAPWNVNVCPPEKYEALKADMKAVGPKGTDPIHICSLNGKQYTIDGAKLDGKSVDLEIFIIDDKDGPADLRFGKLDFKFEPNVSQNKTFSTYVKTSTQMATRKALHDLEEGAVDFLEEYAKLLRAQNPDWLRIEKRKKSEQGEKSPRGNSKGKAK